MVSFFAATMCFTPAITRPTVPFGVRVPPERTRATVIRQQRRAYYGRTAVGTSIEASSAVRSQWARLASALMPSSLGPCMDT
jgi:hypothetical protein